MSRGSDEELIGSSENHTLEFKSAEVLKKPITVARAVVAMLNADGGTIWIGVGEQQGRAAILEQIDRPDRACDALRDHIVDVVEPSPTHEEVRFEVVDDRLRIVVEKGNRQPYAVRRDGRQFLLRIGNRIREMTRDEIAQEFSRRPVDGGALLRAKEALNQELAANRSRFWWCLVPEPGFSIDFEGLSPADTTFFVDVLTNPAKSGNRRNGWTMVLFHDSLPKPRTSGIAHRFGEGDLEHIVNVEPDGTMTFSAPRVRLDRDFNDGGTDISPFALLELPVSAFRITAEVFRRFASAKTREGTTACTAVIGGLKRATLRPGSPNEPSPPWKKPKSSKSDPLAVVPFSIGTSQIIERPDAAAYRLVRRIYEGFDLSEDDIPREFDRGDRILRLR